MPLRSVTSSPLWQISPFPVFIPLLSIVQIVLRMIFLKHKSDHVISPFRSPQWFPVAYRTKSMILSRANEAFHEGAICPLAASSSVAPLTWLLEPPWCSMLLHASVPGTCCSPLLSWRQKSSLYKPPLRRELHKHHTPLGRIRAPWIYHEGEFTLVSSTAAWAPCLIFVITPAYSRLGHTVDAR